MRQYRPHGGSAVEIIGVGDVAEMPIKFSARHLSRAQIDKVYPLAGVALGLSLEEWRDLASRFTGNRRTGADEAGIMCLTGPDETVYAMFSYKLMPGQGDRPVLECDHLVTLDLLHGTEIRDAMERAMDSVARQSGCGAVRIRERAKGGRERTKQRILGDGS